MAHLEVCRWSGKGYPAVCIRPRLQFPFSPTNYFTGDREFHDALILTGYRALGEGSIDSSPLPSKPAKKAPWIPGSGGRGIGLPGNQYRALEEMIPGLGGIFSRVLPANEAIF